MEKPKVNIKELEITKGKFFSITAGLIIISITCMFFFFGNSSRVGLTGNVIVGNSQQIVKQVGENLDNDVVPVYETPKSRSLEYICDYDFYNCKYFISHSNVQEIYDFCGGVENDIHRLDLDKDGIACESLLED